MTGQVDCAVIGKWRVVEADLWDRDYLDLVEPAHIAFEGNGHGEFAAMENSPSVASMAASIANIPAGSSSSPGKGSTKWTKSAATVPPNSMTMAPWKSKSASILATRLC